MFWNRGNRNVERDEIPTEPAPAVHSLLAPKFPPDPKLPTLDEAMVAELDLPRESGQFEVPQNSMFRTAQVLPHVYESLQSPKAKSA